MNARKIGGALLWIVQILAALAMLRIGFAKFSNEFWLTHFQRWGYSDGFRQLIGAVEITAGLLLALPSTALYGVVVMCPILIGAAVTLLRNHEVVFPPIFWLVVLVGIGYARRHRAWRPADRRVPVPADRV